MSFRKTIINQAIYLILTLMLTENAQFFNGAFHLLDGSFYGSDIINNYVARYTKLEMEFNTLRK